MTIIIHTNRKHQKKEEEVAQEERVAFKCYKYTIVWHVS